MRSPTRAAEPVVCLDEKPVSLHADMRPPLPARPGKVAKRDNEYKRCGTANVFCAVEPKAGQAFHLPDPGSLGARVGTRPESNHRAAIRLPAPSTWSWTISTSTAGRPLPTHFGEQKGGYLWNRLTVHYTPKHGSWLNQAEIEISLFARQCLGKRRIPSLVLLQREARAWNRKINRNRSRSTGNSPARTRARSSAIIRTLSRGHRTSQVDLCESIRSFSPGRSDLVAPLKPKNRG